jgi:hypothetical protein
MGFSYPLLSNLLAPLDDLVLYPAAKCWKTNSHDSTVVTQMMGAYNSGFEMLGAPQK